MVPIPSKIDVVAPIEVKNSCNCRTFCCFIPRKDKNCVHRTQKAAISTFHRSPGCNDLKSLE